MGLLETLPKVLKESSEEYETLKAGNFSVAEKIGINEENIMAVGDNLEFMKYLKDERKMAGKLQLIYIDPPFFSKANYGTQIKFSSDKIKNLPPIKQFAYHDSWQDGMDAYLKMLCTRFLIMKDLLSDEGCLWVHLDWHVVHYVKVILDEIFGSENFINEIVWNYKSGGSSKKHFARKHDTLLFYSKTKKYYFSPQKEKSYNRGFKPYRFKGVREYKDDIGWYTMVNMKDVWQIDMVGRTSAERTGYATQKPEALLSRIIESCTREGDYCADFFGGSGTLAATASKMGRKWIYADLGKLAVAGAQKRMMDLKGEFVLMKERDIIEDGGSIEVDVSWDIAETTNKKLLTIELKSYKPKNIDRMPIDEKGMKTVKKIIKYDSLQLVNYWSIDYNYDRETHKTCHIFSKDNGRLETVCQEMGENFNTISIRVVDVFGNSTFTEIDI